MPTLVPRAFETSSEVRMMNRARWCAVVAAAACSVAPLAAQGSASALSPHTSVTNDMLVQAQQSGDWLMYGGNYWNNRYSPLTTLNTMNVKNLVPRMVFQTGTEKLGSLETTPIIVNGVMYITSPVAPNNIV
jgi:glucose dehydrogenase